MSNQPYTVDVTPDGKYWCIDVPAVKRVTMATSIKEIDVMAKDLIEIMTGEKDPAINVVMHLPEAVEESIRLRKAAEQAAERSRAKQREAVLSLHGMGMPFREIGALLGISHQRAHQLVNA
ncbi:hypothetical protein Uis1B_2110 [Bifidobacterium margollesii]|uniref:Uncharacterized protein n=1 Tax=Bifidobacterium margollesii TaxID=2020964 RepID=A0A2N5J772_9BIFI|nr:sigma-70 family RNA polymerase sigma factor [Bifidobacterium margollesii]PLS30059.1 hypothetical protein Uis1B_2110 [Bifidobacterium margollesii]